MTLPKGYKKILDASKDEYKPTQSYAKKDLNETPLDKAIELQYGKLAEDWRQFNTILWGIPAVAVSIMAGIIVVAYQPGLVGWPRFVSLSIGSIFLFALTIEAIKKDYI